MRYMSKIKNLFSSVYDHNLIILMMLFAIIILIFANKEEMEVYHDY